MSKFSGVWLCFCSIGDYVTENGGSNYAAQYKIFEQLVKIIDKEILSKIIGTPKESPSTKPSR